jgi:hypothetical protein
VTDYASAGDVLAAIDRLETAVDEVLARLAAAVPAATDLARSVRADHERHRSAREDLRRRLRASSPAAPPAAAASAPVSLSRASAAAQDLVYAHAEGLPALGDAIAVDVLARHMVDDARHLAVLQMWAEAEQDA